MTVLSYFPIVYFISCKRLIYEFLLLAFSLQNLAMNLQHESMNARWKRKSPTTDGQNVRAAQQHAAYVTLTANEKKWRIVKNIRNKQIVFNTELYDKSCEECGGAEEFLKLFLSKNLKKLSVLYKSEGP